VSESTRHIAAVGRGPRSLTTEAWLASLGRRMSCAHVNGAKVERLRVGQAGSLAAKIIWRLWPTFTARMRDLRDLPVLAVAALLGKAGRDLQACDLVIIAVRGAAGRGPSGSSRRPVRRSHGRGHAGATRSVGGVARLRPAAPGRRRAPPTADRHAEPGPPRCLLRAGSTGPATGAHRVLRRRPPFGGAGADPAAIGLRAGLEEQHRWTAVVPASLMWDDR
jgi:hypothetical protein